MERTTERREEWREAVRSPVDVSRLSEERGATRWRLAGGGGAEDRTDEERRIAAAVAGGGAVRSLSERRFAAEEAE